jgi:hypothetical protein
MVTATGGAVVGGVGVGVGVVWGREGEAGAGSGVGEEVGGTEEGVSETGN